MKWTLCVVLIVALNCGVKGQDKQVPPKIISTFNKEYFFPRGSSLANASFSCKAESDPISYEWQKDGVVLENNKYISVNNTSGSLKISWMETDNYGTYQCFANNSFGTSVSYPFKVQEARLSSFPMYAVQVIRCTQFEHCVVKCRDKPTCIPDSQCRVEWKIGEGTKNNIGVSKRVEVDGNDPLSEPDEMEPMLVFKKIGKAQTGEKGVLGCSFSGYPAPDVEWISPQNQTIKETLGKYEIRDFGRELTILHAESEDEGYYFCKGKVKSKFLQEKVFFNVTSAPVLVGNNQMQDTTVPVGGNATFHCNVSSLSMEFPPSPPMWKINGMNLQNERGNYILSQSSRHLTVTNVQVDDTGIYQCLSKNSEGVLLKEAILKVIDPIIIRERPLSSYKIMSEEMLNLAVIADSNPSLILQYKWMFTDLQGNQREIESNEFWKTSWPTNNNLTIDVSQVSNPRVVRSLTGFYSVKIYHKYDQKIIIMSVETATISTEDVDQGTSDTTTAETDIIPTGLFIFPVEICPSDVAIKGAPCQG
uniref:Neural cell adhesion molecule L1-like isoform X1 n=1 Tax=Crassostrea virginica TaxID=6565 RepID=A0A8B8EAS7_CRAVI|nr:neural cell adhesion molecule L1-like isoform X1 [Crassostrea virginica]